MKVVIRRVLERAQLRAVGRRPEGAVRKGVTFVPKHGARAIQTAPPTPAPAPVEPLLRRQDPLPAER